MCWSASQRLGWNHHKKTMDFKSPVLTSHRRCTPTYRHIHAKEGIRTSGMQDGKVSHAKQSQMLMHLALRHYENCWIWAMVLRPGCPSGIQAKRGQGGGVHLLNFLQPRAKLFQHRWGCCLLQVHCLPCCLPSNKTTSGSSFHGHMLSFPMPSSISCPTISLVACKSVSPMGCSERLFQYNMEKISYIHRFTRTTPCTIYHSSMDAVILFRCC